jgi:hypothetical protein
MAWAFTGSLCQFAAGLFHHLVLLLVELDSFLETPFHGLGRDSVARANVLTRAVGQILHGEAATLAQPVEFDALRPGEADGVVAGHRRGQRGSIQKPIAADGVDYAACPIGGLQEEGVEARVFKR